MNTSTSQAAGTSGENEAKPSTSGTTTATTTSNAATSNATTSSATPEQSRQSNLQRIKQRKQQLYNWQHNKKLLKLAIYSACQGKDCKCSGWKTPRSEVNRTDTTQPLASLTDPCRTCTHNLENHITHLSNLAETEINRLLGIVVDVENIFMGMHREQDVDTRRIYFFLFKMLCTSILKMTKPVIDGTESQPPFEVPNIATATTNFVFYKFRDLSQKDWQTIYDLAKMFLNCLNHWNFETPSAKKGITPEEAQLYKINYRRWLIFCHVPAFCDSLQHYETTQVFGRSLLIAVFKSVYTQLMDKCISEKNRMPPEKRVLILKHFPRFLAMLEEEIFTPNSPIWDLDFKKIPPAHLQPSLTAEGKAIPTATLMEKLQLTHGDDKRLGEEITRTDIKRIKTESDDIPEETIAEIITTINDSKKNVPDVLFEEKEPRDKKAKQDEADNIISLRILGNSLTKPIDKQDMLWFIDIQNLICLQLPRMPMDYVSRHVFDPNHQTLVVIKNNRPFGAICFRTFASQGFTEIVFCVISTSAQCKGHGTYLMNHLKDYHIKKNILHLLTFGDEYATEYFKKQGFSKNVKLEKHIYEGYIKYYKSATLMHCELNPSIIYTEFTTVVRQQKEIVKKLLEKQMPKFNNVYPGLTLFKKGVHSIPLESIPGLIEAGWKPEHSNNNSSSSSNSSGTGGRGRTTMVASRPPLLNEELLHTYLSQLLTEIRNHKAAWPFLEPVDKKDAPEYYEYILYPMDLRTMGEKLAVNYYVVATKHLFIADMNRIFTNCKSFNGPDTEYYNCAVVLENFFKARISKLGIFDKKN